MKPPVAKEVATHGVHVYQVGHCCTKNIKPKYLLRCPCNRLEIMHVLQTS